ncbi:MAG: GNAT family N-acetyltransferase [Candidatus Eisenbacteria bacterium]
MASKKNAGLEVLPLTKSRWGDFEALFGPKGAYAGCWCMWWRLTRKEFEKNQGEGNRRAMKRIVEGGDIPGVLAYEMGKPVAWCSIAPRESYPSVERSPVLKRLDDRPVWSIVCLFVARGHRGKGVALRVLRGAVDYARSRGAKIVEAYPTAPRGKELPPVSSFMGVPALFEAAGFRECARPSKARVIMRRHLRPAGTRRKA